MCPAEQHFCRTTIHPFNWKVVHMNALDQRSLLCQLGA